MAKTLHTVASQRQTQGSWHRTWSNTAVDGYTRLEEIEGEREKVQILFAFLLSFSIIEGETNPAQPAKSLLTPVPCLHDRTLHLYVSSLVMKGSQLLLSFPLAPVQLLCRPKLPILIYDSSFIHFQPANNF